MAGFQSLSVPYHPPREGWWGEKTSTLNFCEEDYVMSYYVAEVCNTLTNLMFIWLGFKGIRDCLKYSHPTIFVIAFVGYMVVGVGSTFFHASLKYPMQLVDELSMIYTTCFMCYATFSYGRSKALSFLLGTGLIGLAWFITSHYYHTKDPQFHQDAYAVLTAVVVFSNMWIMEKHVRPGLKERQAKRAPGLALPSADVLLKQMWLMVITGLSVFLGGFLIWNLDNIYCQNITRWRHQIQLPLAVLLEGHAWWHLMTGIGGAYSSLATCTAHLMRADGYVGLVCFTLLTLGLAYYYITWRIWVHRCLDGDEDKYQLQWLSVFAMPEVVAIDGAHGNGVVKKLQ